MAFADDLAALKRDLKEARIPVDDVLAIAGVNRSSWTRWGNLHIPRTDRWNRVREVAETLIKERGPADVQDAA